MKSLIQSLIFVCIGASLTACAKPEGGAPRFEVPQAFAQYVGAFQQVAAQEGQALTVSNLVIQYAALDNPMERGVCRIGGSNPPTIIINSTTWPSLTEAERQELLFHELGHCVLRRVHLAGSTADGIPQSMMNPFALASNTYEQNIDYYHSELFSVVNQF